MRALATRAAEHAADPMPGFTHLQTAQPVTFGHHLLAYVEMFARDRGRFADARAPPERMPAGRRRTGRHVVPDRPRHDGARRSASTGPTANSLDAVSDRDFALEYLAAAAISAMHLSRFAEEIVIWCSAPFGFIRLSDAFTTGSSIMPQKRNPDAAELIRAKTGRIIGALVALLTVMKGLPLAYAKDMQEDKEPVFDATDALGLSLAATAGMVRDLRPDTARMRAAGRLRLFHRDRPRRLAGARRWAAVPHRPPRHRPAGGARRGRRACALAGLPLAEMQAEQPAHHRSGVFAVLTVEASVASRTSYGGTAPANVAAQAARGWRFWVMDLSWLTHSLVAGDPCRRGRGPDRCILRHPDDMREGRILLGRLRA